MASVSLGALQKPGAQGAPRRGCAVGRSRRRGLETIEAALVLPIVLMLSFGVMEYGWLFLKYHQITNAARQGARVAAMPDATGSTVSASVGQVMTASGMGQSGVYTITYKLNSGTASASFPSARPGDNVTVIVSLPAYSKVGLLNVPLIPVPASLKANVTLAKEGP